MAITVAPCGRRSWRFYACERDESRPRERFILIAALTSLDVIATELDTNRVFFDASSPYFDPSVRSAELESTG